MRSNSEPSASDPWADTITSINSCPYYLLLGMRVVTMGNGRARLMMPVGEKLLQMYGMVHGGALASLADSAMGVALISAYRKDEMAVTVELKVNFVSPAREGVLTADATLFQRGRTIAGGEVEITDAGGRLIAKGMGTCVPLRAK